MKALQNIPVGAKNDVHVFKELLPTRDRRGE
jgi:hypothetical protein